MIDRRAFVAGAALVAVAPACRLLPSDAVANVTNVTAPVLAIDGWSVQDDSDPGNQVWLQSWSRMENSVAMNEIAVTYLSLGVQHILLGFDHLLFVLALLILVRDWRRVVITVTAFTVAHSITLAACDPRRRSPAGISGRGGDCALDPVDRC